MALSPLGRCIGVIGAAESCVFCPRARPALHIPAHCLRWRGNLRAKARPAPAGAPFKAIRATTVTLSTAFSPAIRLTLAAGTYTTELRITNLNGTASQHIVIKGPDTGPRPLFLHTRHANGHESVKPAFKASSLNIFTVSIEYSWRSLPTRSSLARMSLVAVMM